MFLKAGARLTFISANDRDDINILTDILLNRLVAFRDECTPIEILPRLNQCADVLNTCRDDEIFTIKEEISFDAQGNKIKMFHARGTIYKIYNQRIFQTLQGENDEFHEALGKKKEDQTKPNKMYAPLKDFHFDDITWVR